MSSSFGERYSYFKQVLSPIWLFKSEKELQLAKEIVNTPGVPNERVSVADVKWARTLYASAFHPDTGQVNPLIGRMSFQIPGNTIVTALMLTFYRSPLQQVSMQFINQSFMAFCNYTNRNAQAPLSNQQVLLGYLSATGTAVGVSFQLSRVAAKATNPLMAKLVPFVAVCAGNMVNVPLMRQQDFLEGIPVNDSPLEQGGGSNRLGQSRQLGVMCLAQVVATRISAAIPIMVLPPLVMNYLNKSAERRNIQVHKKSFGRPLWVLFEASLIGVCTYMVLPLAVALFPQHSSISIDKLERPLHRQIKETHPNVQVVYYNKGL
ncbi:sideroflexin-3-like [Symsagittifera roscoffensis]|uniref:sideroflexin-3-like n=1 Tax=Symsagittifera roscoffensis TaxID=84072 RepID=UPI00307B63AD